MITRVATSAAPRTMLNNLQIAGRGLLTAQEQLTTGKRINRMSDSPADAVSALAQRASMRRLQQFGRNALEANSWLAAGDSALSSVSDRLSSARSLLVQANSAASDSTSRAAIAGEIRALRGSIIQAANTSLEGRQIFAGTSTASTAYGTTGTYQGDLGAVRIPVGDGVTVTVNQTGPAVFGTFNATDPTDGDVFQLLESLAVAVETGATAAIGTGLTLIDAAATRVANAQVKVGTTARQVEDLSATIEDSLVALQERNSATENVDLAEAVIAVKTREAAYQAALQATAKVIQPSLLDFLR